MSRFHAREAAAGLWDLVALGEVMLRLDPGDERITTTRSFRVWEGGGEYNVARGLRRCFGLRTAVVTALADNPVGRLIEDLILQGGVDTRFIRWEPYDGVGRSVRNGLNFTERGFGVRGAVGCSDRGHTAASQLKPGDVDWDAIFENTRGFHCGCILGGLAPTTADVVGEAITAARRHGTVISYDLNYRASLWKNMGGQQEAQAVNRRLVSDVDVLIGNEEDFGAALGFEVEGVDANFARLDPESFAKMITEVTYSYPNVSLVATTLRSVQSASRNDWGALCWADGELYRATERAGLEVFDRVGGGDSFASGLIFGLLSAADVQTSIEYAVAHGALAMTTPGDTSMATAAEVIALASGASARIKR